MTLRFQGIYAALTTPFVEGEVSLDHVRENIRRYNGTGLRGYLVLGSTAESVSLSDEESAAILRAVREEAAPGMTLIVGTARESTRLTIDFTRRMADLGGQAALVRTPGFFRSQMTGEALKRHYVAVADASPIPVLIYNIPQATGVSIDAAAIVELAGHPNIAGLKDSSGAMATVGEVVPRAGRDFDFLLGAGSIVLPGLVMGARGAILAVADAVPELCAELYRRFAQGELDAARRIQDDLVPLNRAVVPVYGVAGLKFALDRLGYRGGLPRPPLLPLSDKGRAEIDGLLGTLGLLRP